MSTVSARRPESTPGARLAPAFAALLVAALASCSPATPLPSPIIVITIDTLRADRVGAYGYGRDTTPHIDELAAQGVLFENVSTTIATTLPAHVSLWTSMYPLQTGILDNRDHFDAERSPEVRFFAARLREAGYTTAAFVSATPVKRETGIDVGFDLYDQPLEAQRDARATTERVLEWLDAHADEPFFLWIHYFDPHYPWDPPEPYHLAFETDEVLLEYMRERGFPSPDNPLIRMTNNQYDGEILFVDAQIRRLLDALEEHELYDPATVVITSDHGEGLGQHGYMVHGRVYNEHVLIPLIIKFPAGSGRDGQRRENMVSLVDIVPTLIARLELPVDRSGMVGVDALDDRTPRGELLAQRAKGGRNKPWKGRKLAMTTEDWKLHVTNRGCELYDMQEDAWELANIASEHPDVARALQERLRALVARYDEQGGLLHKVEDVSSKAQAELEKLGYTGD
jgi:arylsulfatase A-like enzyme